MRRVFLLVLVSAAGAASAQTQAQMNAEACAAYSESDARLNEVYGDLVVHLRGSPRRVSALRTAQLTWVRYRDQHVAFLCPNPAECGSIWPLQRCSALRYLTEERTALLEQELSEEF